MHTDRAEHLRTGDQGSQPGLGQSREPGLIYNKEKAGVIVLGYLGAIGRDQIDCWLIDTNEVVKVVT